MRLLRVQVPEFRALKDVDISFEPDFVPQVFPLGSLNGGGKSTLLQLIFVLLDYADYAHEQILSSPLKNKIDQTIQAIKYLSEESNDDNWGWDKKQQLKKELKQQEIELEQLKNAQKNKEVNLKATRELSNILAELKPDKQVKDFVIITLYYENQTVELKFSWQLTTYPIGVPVDKMILALLVNNESLWDSPLLTQKIAKKIFLISPSNQPYLFLSRGERQSLFTKDNKSQYDQAVKNTQERLSNFLTFDFIDVLVEVFRRARANDFKERNKDNPFAHTEKLEADINNLFIDGKKINSLIIEQQRHTQDEIQGVFFTLPSGQEVYPEDLSHGELKRLAIFVLIKYHKMQDSVVLMDEIENGFHLDWQYTIVRNLVEWGKNNQYILATHSYELCTAVTPAHVKEIEPKLTAK